MNVTRVPAILREIAGQLDSRRDRRYVYLRAGELREAATALEDRERGRDTPASPETTDRQTCDSLARRVSYLEMRFDEITGEAP